MDLDWTASSYREIINDCLGYRNKRRPRGVIKKLADSLRCHSTFIAQVLNGRADFSAEQGLEISRHFAFSPDQQEFFLTLLLRDRSGTKTLKEYYQKKLDYIHESRRDLKSKVQPKEDLSGAFEAEYFGNWIYQAAHALTQVDRYQSAAALSKVLGRSIEEIGSILLRLQTMDLVKQHGTSWESTLTSLHLSKDSPFIRALHTGWKTKLLTDLQTATMLEGTHYSGVITVTSKDYERVRDVLVKSIADIRKVVEGSTSENAYVLSLDCYKM